MLKSRLKAVVCILLAVLLSGCWNYTSLDQVNIIVGIAIDFDKEKNLYDLSYEAANLEGASIDSSISGKIINSDGKTLFDAARNAKRTEADRLFFGSAQVLVISQQLAREAGMMSIIEWFLRDGECRETMCVAISQQETASELLESSEERSGIVSSTLHDIISEDKDLTGTALRVQLYQIYNALNSPRRSVAIPALRKVEDDGDKIPEINGMAVIKGNALAGFLSPKQSRYVLFVEEQMGSGILTLSMSDRPAHDVSLEIFWHKASKEYTYENGKIDVSIKTDTQVAVAENHTHMNMMDEHTIEKIEFTAARMIERDIKDLISELQHKYNADIFGFGEMIYKKDLKLWDQLSPSWDEIYPTLDVDVTAKVRVINTGFIK
ncbi:MAG: Ger(x)C family spore germination protein [Christensenellales bacterium]|jgi:spore germination protein KC